MLRVHEGGGRAVRGLNLGPDAPAEGPELLPCNLSQRTPDAAGLFEVLEDAVAEVRYEARHGNPGAEGREDAPRASAAAVNPAWPWQESRGTGSLKLIPEERLNGLMPEARSGRELRTVQM